MPRDEKLTGPSDPFCLSLNPKPQVEMTDCTTRPDIPMFRGNRSQDDTIIGDRWAVGRGSGDERCFFDLPLEIRLQVYYWVYRVHPVRSTSGCMKAVLSTPMYEVKPISSSTSPSTEIESQSQAENPTNGSRTPSSGPPLPLHHLPSAFLLTNRQLYHEARTIPFTHNDFGFGMYFSSGLVSARAFHGGLQPWQKRAVRHARIELLGRELLDRGSEPARLAAWMELCGEDVWSEGLRTLRMRILAGVSMDVTVRGGCIDNDAAVMDTGRGDPSTYPDGNIDESSESGKDDGERDIGKGDGSIKVPFGRTAKGQGQGPMEERTWIREGLMKLKALERLEIEIEAGGILLDEEKLRWCRLLEGVVRRRTRRGGLRAVEVVCVEKVVERDERKTVVIGCGCCG